MMWMTGSEIHMFSIMMVFFSCRTPVMSFINLPSAFSRLEDNDSAEKGEVQFMWQKVAYVACNCVTLGLSLYQLQRLGKPPAAAPRALVGWLRVVSCGVDGRRPSAACWAATVPLQSTPSCQ